MRMRGSVARIHIMSRISSDDFTNVKINCGMKNQVWPPGHHPQVDAAPGQVICHEGDPADSFYLIRIGFVRVSQSRGGEEMVLARSKDSVSSLEFPLGKALEATSRSSLDTTLANPRISPRGAIGDTFAR